MKPRIPCLGRRRSSERHKESTCVNRVVCVCVFLESNSNSNNLPGCTNSSLPGRCYDSRLFQNIFPYLVLEALVIEDVACVTLQPSKDTTSTRSFIRPSKAMIWAKRMARPTNRLPRLPVGRAGRRRRRQSGLGRAAGTNATWTSRKPLRPGRPTTLRS